MFATVSTRSLGDREHGVVLRWSGSREQLPDALDAVPVFEQALADARVIGASGFESRVVLEQVDLDREVVSARAEWLAAVLARLGFAPCSRRLEFRADVANALAVLEAELPGDRLAWRSIACAPGEEIERVSRVLSAASAGDPDSIAQQDAVGFVLARLEVADETVTPECTLLGVQGHDEVAVVLTTLRPATAVGSVYYLGVVPQYRGMGLGLEALRQALRVMHAQGARVYHDGTSATNAPALALLRRIGATPYRTMEQWRTQA